MTHVSYADNLELQIWKVRYIENKIGKIQATFLTFVFIIPGSAIFTTFFQVSSSMYAGFFVITQNISRNPHLVTRLVSLSLGWTKLPFYINIAGPLTSSEISIQRALLKTLIHCNCFHGFFFFPRITFISP